MDLTKRDIHEKQFHDAWRGYNQEEVDDFLDRVADVLDEVQRENLAVSERIHELEQSVATSREAEEMLKKTLVTAQQAAEEAIAKARAKAEHMVAEAEERSRRLNQEITEKLQAAEAEIRRKELDSDRAHTARKRDLDISIERLSAFESELKRKLREFLSQQLRSLDGLNERPASLAEPAPARALTGVPGGAGQTPPPQERPRGAFARRLEAARSHSGTEGGPMLEDAPGAVAASRDDDDLEELEEEDTHHRRGVLGLFHSRDDG